MGGKQCERVVRTGIVGEEKLEIAFGYVGRNGLKAVDQAIDIAFFVEYRDRYCDERLVRRSVHGVPVRLLGDCIAATASSIAVDRCS